MKKLINFSESCWHYKLIRFTWDIDPKRFKNLCPYFWLTVASIILFPLAALSTVVRKFFGAVDRICEKGYLSRLSEAQLYYVYMKSSGKFIAGSMYPSFSGLRTYKNVDSFLKAVGKTKEEIERYKGRYGKVYEREALEYNKELDREAENRRKREQRQEKLYDLTMKVSMATKKIFLVLGVIILFLFFSCLCSLFTNIICYFILNPVSIDVLKVLAIGLGAIMFGVFVGNVLGVYERDGKKYIQRYKPWGYLWISPVLLVYLPLKYILFEFLIKRVIYYFLWRIVIVGVSKGIASCITEYWGIFGDYLNASYSDYCPGINWKEKEDKK